MAASTIAREVREFAKANGLPVSDRGRISKDVYTAYFMNKPRVAREIAATHGIEIGSRGRVSETVAYTLALAEVSAR